MKHKWIHHWITVGRHEGNPLWHLIEGINDNGSWCWKCTIFADKYYSHFIMCSLIVSLLITTLERFGSCKACLCLFNVLHVPVCCSIRADSGQDTCEKLQGILAAASIFRMFKSFLFCLIPINYVQLTINWKSLGGWRAPVMRYIWPWICNEYGTGVEGSGSLLAPNKANAIELLYCLVLHWKFDEWSISFIWMG